MTDAAASPRPARGLIHAGVAEELGAAIVSGRLRPGDLLPGEDRFSAERGISRSAYREAVKMLAAKGLVVSRTKSGTRVTERSAWNMLDVEVLAWAFAAGPDVKLLTGLFELRSIVEPEAAALAARRRDAREIGSMGHALEEMARFGLLRAEGRAADERFHALLLIATRNDPLIALSNSISAAVRWTTTFARDYHHEQRDPMPDHYAVYQALTEGDPAAARAAMAALIAHATRDARIGD